MDGKLGDGEQQERIAAKQPVRCHFFVNRKKSEKITYTYATYFTFAAYRTAVRSSSRFSRSGNWSQTHSSASPHRMHQTILSQTNNNNNDKTSTYIALLKL